MIEPKIIYIVTSGSYSDYRIQSVFTDKAEAERYRDLIDPSGCDAEIEEWPLDVEFICPPGLLPYCVRMDKDGNADVEQVREDYYRESSRQTGAGWSGSLPKAFTCCFARDAQHAAKIANERRVLAIAENRWPFEGTP